MKKSVFTACILTFAVFGLFSIDYFAEGERLFRENKPVEAIPLLYQASVQGGTDQRVFLYLGLSYQQTGKYADAISSFMRGTSMPGTDRKSLFFNAGNVYYLQNQFIEADMMYTRTLETDSAYAQAYLNRANTRVNLSRFKDAISDYTVYLTLDPATWQKDSIQQLVNLLSGALQEEEALALRSEAEKLAKEAERKAAEERYQQLLDAVSTSLQSVDNASTLSAGSEDIEFYDEESELE